MPNGLYNGFNAENSTQIRKYQGSALNEVVKVADQLQKQFDIAEEGIEAGYSLNRNTKVLDTDKPLFDKRSAEYNEKLKGWASKPDLENVYKDVLRSGKRFAEEYQNFAANRQAVADYDKLLQERVKDKYISQETAQGLLRESKERYTGLKRDEATGQYSNPFTGTDPAQEVDINKWTKDVVADMAHQKGGHIQERIDGLYFKKDGAQWEKLRPEDIQAAVDLAYSLDPTIQADFRQRARLTTHAQLRNGQKIQDLPVDKQKEIIEAANAAGVKPEDYFKAYLSESNLTGLKSNLRNFGLKYQVNDYSDSHTYEGGTWEYHDLLNQKNAEYSRPVENRFSVPGPNMQLEGAPTDIESMDKFVGEAHANHIAKRTRYNEIKASRDAEANGGPKSQFTAQDLLDAKAENDESYDDFYDKYSMRTGARDEIAKRMNYKDFEDFKKKNNITDAQITESSDRSGFRSIQKALGSNVWMDPTDSRWKQKTIKIGNGEMISPSDVTRVLSGYGYDKALQDLGKNGKIEFTNDQGKRVDIGANTELGKKILQARDIKVAKWKEINDVSSGGTANSNNPLTRFNKLYEEEIKNNKERYSVKTTEINFSDEEVKDLGRAIANRPGAFSFFKAGTNEPAEAPTFFDLGMVRIAQKRDGSVVLSGQGRNAKKTNGEPGGPSGEFYDVHVAPGSTIGKYIGSNIINKVKRKEYLSPNMKVAAMTMMGYSVSPRILDLKPKGVATIRKDGKPFVTVQNRLGANGQYRYAIYGPTGGEIKRPDGGTLEFRDAGEASDVILQLMEADNQD